MDISKLKWTRLQSEIFRLLCIKAGQALNLTEIAKRLDRSLTAVSKSLAGLEKEKFIKVGRIGKINLLSIELNRDNQDALNMKRVENLKIIYESGLADFLREVFPGCTIILFGSYSMGEDISLGGTEKYESDIDIAVIGTKGKEVDLMKFDNILERKITLNFYTSFEVIHKHLLDSILNGILLSGSIDL